MVTTATTTSSRDVLIARLHEDLVGPGEPDELIAEQPTDRYLTGILWPKRSTLAAEEDDGASGGANVDGNEEEADEADAKLQLAGQVRPASMGLSFTVMMDGGGRCSIDVRIRLATYRPVHRDATGAWLDGPGETRKQTAWRRTQHDLRIDGLQLASGYHKAPPAGDWPTGLELHYQALPDGTAMHVTLALINGNVRADGESRIDSEANSFLQVELEVAAGNRITARQSHRHAADEESEASRLLYRDVRHYAVGHTCAAGWTTDEQGRTTVRTEWLPAAKVPKMNERGGPELAALVGKDGRRPLAAEWLASAPQDELVAGLRMVPQCYAAWIKRQEQRIPSLSEPLQDVADRQLQQCRDVRKRIESAIATIERDADIRRCFMLANRAIAMAFRWRAGGAIEWRPFQLAFVLLVLDSIADPAHADRDTMDLLWFPTGGGKTEAYLALIAFLLFHRRLRADGDAGAGTAAIMRYTLRALTIQQFQRATGVVLACELLRREAGDRRLGTAPFSIGLWVGGGATPNTHEEARKVGDGSPSDHRQLTHCPACRTRLDWKHTTDGSAMHVRCKGSNCSLASIGPLPIWTIDEDIYRELPSLLIGTVDKFAQIVRKQDVGGFFGIGTGYMPPDLIVQDELHLISGPLGTIAGLYETAIDQLCARGGPRPKILGSTATIRRATQQIRSLFDRDTCQFPPPGIDHDDSGFAVVDHAANGRVYVGVTSVGRSPKFAMQSVAASLLLSATADGIAATDQPGYSTLLAYFNSLRELGAALVLMQDDVNMSIRAFADRRREKPRQPGVPAELTSRKSARDIRDLLDELGREDCEHAILLASNMISVGVDIPRLSLMTVVGQPKTIAEYIQATSRVGRGSVPGLVVDVFNHARSRDRSHYETFRSWHGALYREVEATSVTPFASRSVDKALHATLVILARHLVAGMDVDPTLDDARAAELQRFRDVILARVAAVDPDERASVRAALDRFIEGWQTRGKLEKWWDDDGKKAALLMSAEQHAALRASGANAANATPTLNSMRDVEASTVFKLLES
jgi:hypothetical protein